MTKNFDIYITHPEGLEKSDEALHKLIGAYTEHLDLMLQRLIGRKPDIARKGVDFNQGTFTDYIDKSKLVLLFIHSSFLNSEEYNEEMAEIAIRFDQSSLNGGSAMPGVFKVCLDAITQPLKSDFLEHLFPYNFYFRNIFNRKIKSLDFDDESGNSTIHLKLLDLCYDMVDALKGPEVMNDAGEPRDTVFLGYSTFDQLESLEEIRRELQDLNYEVLPHVNIPNSPEEFERMLVKNLYRSRAAIQLMGAHYGDIMKGTKYSIMDFQNRIISDFQTKNPDQRLMRYIWIPVSSKINDQRQVLYLKRLKRDEAGVHTEIIESPIETFKTILTNRLEKKDPDGSIAYENVRKVYLMSEREISEDTDDLFSALLSSGLRVYTLDYNEQIGIYTRHLKMLRNCDSVIVYQQDGNRFWLNSKLRDLIKAPGIGREEPFRKVILLTSEQPDDELIKIMHTKVDIIPANQANAKIVLQKLIDE